MSTDIVRERLTTIAEGVHRFDTHYVRPAHTSCTIVVDAGRAAIFDAGVAANVDALLAALDGLGIEREAVDYAIASHAHLDHMGGMGRLVRHLPNARVAAHPSAAPHLVDPARLEAGARTVFGDAFFEREFAGVEPVPAERIVETEDEATLTVGGRELRVVHAPGHAWHQQAVHDPRTATVLAGDAFGVAYPELTGADGPLAILSTVPPQLSPEAMQASIERIVALRPARVQPAHFAVLESPGVVAEALYRQLEEWTRLALEAESVEGLAQVLADSVAAELERRGRGSEAPGMRELYSMDIEINAQGLWYWRKRREEKAAAAQSK